MHFSSLHLSHSILGAASLKLFGSARAELRRNWGEEEVEMTQLPMSDLFLPCISPPLLSSCKAASPPLWQVDRAREEHPKVSVCR